MNASIKETNILHWEFKVLVLNNHFNINFLLLHSILNNYTQKIIMTIIVIGIAYLGVW